MLILSLVIALIISLLIVWLVYRADKKRVVPYPIVTATLRGLLFFLCALLLLAPKINKKNMEEQKPIVLLLQDNSLSVKSALGNNAAQYFKNINDLTLKLSSKYRLITWNLNGITNKDSLDQLNAPSTNISDAINKATELYGQQNLSSIIVASDGWYNEGNNPIYSDIPLNGSLYTIAIGDTTIAKDLRIAKIYANKSASINSQWEIRADIIATKCAGVQQNINLLDASGNIIASAPININSDKHDASISFTTKLDKAGLQHFSINTATVTGEQNTTNNKANVFVDVIQEKKKILLLAAAPHPDIKAISESIKNLEQYELVVKMASEGINNFSDYACIILHQLPSISTPIPESLIHNKSVWYIAGTQSDYNQINTLQKGLTFGAKTVAHSAEAFFDKSFNSFTLAPNIASIGDILPPLTVGTNDISELGNVQCIWKDASGKPLWAIVSGNPATAILCGEGLWHWRLYEYKNTKQHKVIDECIVQTINFLTTNNNSKPFRTESTKYVWSNTEHVNINAFLYNANNELINQPEANIVVKDSVGNTQKYTFEKNGTAYRIDLGALAAGTYNYTAQTNLNGKTLTDVGRFIVEESSIEAQESGCNYPLLYALAKKNNGSTFTTQTMLSVLDSMSHNTNIKPLLNEQIEATDLINWKWIFVLILLVATAEWLLRKYWMAM